MSQIGTVTGTTVVVGSDEQACAAYAKAASTSEKAAAAARADTMMAGVHQVVSFGGQRIDIVDATGLVLMTVTPDGAIYADKFRRPGSIGFIDALDMGAELDLLKQLVAGALVLSPTTAKLRNAIRNYGFFPAPGYRLAAADKPVLTVGVAGGAPTIAGGLVAANDPRFMWASGPCISRATFTGIAGYPGDIVYNARGTYAGRNGPNTADVRHGNYSAPEFLHTGSAFEAFTFSSGNPIRVLVNGVDAGMFTLDNDHLGAFYYLKVAFPGVGTRRIRLESAGVPIAGIRVAASSEIGAADRVYPIATIISDSFGDAPPSPPADWEGIIALRALGFSVAAAPLGQTGLVNPAVGAQNLNNGGGPKVNFVDPKRLVDLTLAGVVSAQPGAPVAPDLGVICGSINDTDPVALNASIWGSYATSLPDAITRNAFKAADAWLAANAGKPLVFLGPTWSNGTPTQDVYRNRDAIAEACAAMRSSNVHFLDRLMPPMRVGLAADAGTQAAMYNLSNGDPHPSVAGHRFDGLSWGGRLRNLIMSEFA